MKVKIMNCKFDFILDLNTIENIFLKLDLHNYYNKKYILEIVDNEELTTKLFFRSKEKRDSIYKKLVWLTKANILMNQKGIE